ncbi:alpha/beta hydrolase [Salinibacillus aidingensis]|uniref:Alpha/beta hydrolase n=1 Tax=Salinibacillus aidingensis TaxID=237684 RepID=A0ABP3L877_9BACI
MEIQVHEWGDKESRTLVLLHGMGSTGLNFSEWTQHLKEDFHIVALDLPGHGRTHPFPDEEDYHPSYIANQLGKQIKKAEKSGVILVGHSWGAHLALYIAKAFPELVDGVVLLDGGYLQIDKISKLEDELEQVEKVYNQVRFPSWEAFIEAEKSETNHWSDELEKAAKAQMTERDGEVRLAASVPTTRGIIKGIFSEPTRDVFSCIDCPVLLLISTIPEELEELRREAIGEMKQKMMNLNSIAIPDTTHNIYVDAPEDVADKLITWVRDELTKGKV